MNILLGANGFIGKHLSKKINCVPLKHQDIDKITLQNFDNLFYLASYGNMIHQTEDAKTMKANVNDVIRIIDMAVRLDFKSFVFFSTSSVKLRTQTVYSRAKRAAEEILLAYLEKYNKPICIIRPFSVTGVGEQKEHLIPKLIDSCFTGNHMSFVSSPTHDFIDVDDVCEGVLNLAKHSARGIFELGTGKAYTNRQVLELVEKVTGKKANVTEVPTLRKYDNEYWVSQNFRSRGWGWMPKKSLEQSIVEMVADYERTQKKNT